MTILEICDHLSSLIADLHEESKSEQWDWGEIPARSDEQHVDDFRDSLAKTRQHFNLGDEPQPMHGCFVKGTDIVLCHTGTSPTSRARARFIASTDPMLIQILIDHIRRNTSTNTNTISKEPPSCPLSSPSN